MSWNSRFNVPLYQNIFSAQKEYEGKSTDEEAERIKNYLIDETTFTFITNSDKINIRQPISYN